MELMPTNNLAKIWEQSKPIEEDLSQVWEQSKPITLSKKGAVEPVPEALELEYATLGDISLKATEKYGRPFLEFGGLTGGSLVGAASPVPGGTIIGGGLGYGMGKETANLLYGEKRGPIKQELIKSAKDVATGAAIEAGGQVIGLGIGKLVKDYGVPAATKLTTLVRKNIEKAIRPSAALQKTAGMAKQYYRKATEAVSSIIANKNNLRLTDETGKVVSGLPKTLKQFSEAIQQTKQVIFKEYDELAKIATEGSATVPLSTMTKELEVIANNKVLNDMAPGAAQYAASMAKVLKKRGTYTPLEAQEAIQMLNSKLDAFYKNPSFEFSSKVQIDAMVANNLRKSLDATIGDLTGKQYQQLKNTYGALSHIEKDVARRAAVDARKNIKGLVDFSDLFSGAEVVGGILRRDPTMVGMGATTKGIAQYIKHINNPNRIVNKMFQGAEQLIGKTTVPTKKAGRELLGRTTTYVLGRDGKLYPKEE